MRCLIMIAFIIGLFFYTMNKRKFETMKGNMFEDCPNILLQQGKELVLLNTKKAKIPGVNPIHFESLEDYVEYLEWQRNTGTFCPVLYLQKTYDSQNNAGYRILPDPFDPNAGLPSKPPHMNENIPGKAGPCSQLTDAGRGHDRPHNKGSYPGFDPLNQYIGEFTCLDKMKPKQMQESKKQMKDFEGNTTFYRNIEGMVSREFNHVEGGSKHFQIPYSSLSDLKLDQDVMAKLDEMVEHNRFMKHS